MMELVNFNDDTYLPACNDITVKSSMSIYLMTILTEG